MLCHLTVKGEEATAFNTLEEAQAAFEAANLNCHNVSMRWDNLITNRANIYGPLGAWFGYLCEPFGTDED